MSYHGHRDNLHKQLHSKESLLESLVIRVKAISISGSHSEINQLLATMRVCKSDISRIKGLLK